MSKQPTIPHTGPAARLKTQKAKRRAVAAAANNPAVFQRTEFGRRRVRAFPVRLALRLVALLTFPFVLSYRVLRALDQPDSL